MRGGEGGGRGRGRGRARRRWRRPPAARAARGRVPAAQPCRPGDPAAWACSGPGRAAALHLSRCTRCTPGNSSAAHRQVALGGGVEARLRRLARRPAGAARLRSSGRGRAGRRGGGALEHGCQCRLAGCRAACVGQAPRAGPSRLAAPCEGQVRTVLWYHPPRRRRRPQAPAARPAGGWWASWRGTGGRWPALTMGLEGRAWRGGGRPAAAAPAGAPEHRLP